MNTGAFKSQDARTWYGNYYAWGEIETKNVYIWKNYKYGVDYNRLTKYCSNPEYSGYEGFKDNLMQLLLEDDAAYQNMHLDNKFYLSLSSILKLNLLSTICFIKLFIIF